MALHFVPIPVGPRYEVGCAGDSRRLRATDGELHGVAATIDSSDSAPATPAAYRGAPPTHLSTFVGRERELAELEALVAEARLVTLTGPGGSGKTRLALEFVARARDRLPDNAFFVDLAPITDPELMPPTIAATLGIRVDPRRPALDALIDCFAERRLLLILDNLEQLPDVAPLIADLLRRCQNLRVLATSRSHLHVRGERQYTVEPLALPEPADLESPERLERTEAVALFVERAKGANSSFALGMENCVAVAEICRRLDGLPLAIELAAARSKLLTPHAILRRLERRLPVLAVGTVDSPARQRTLSATIAWSYDLLDPGDQRVFARLSVFVGGFSLVAVDAVVGDPEHSNGAELLEVLARLVDHHLVRVAPDAAGEPRFGMLETIREFALGRLSNVETEALRRRHLEYFALFVEEAGPSLHGAEGASRLRQLIDDLDNLRAALDGADTLGDAEHLCRLVVALSQFLTRHGHEQEAGRWLHAAEAVAAPVEPRLHAKLLRHLAKYELAHSGDRVLAKRQLTEALSISGSLGDQVEMARLSLTLADVDSDLNELETARHWRNRALSITRDLTDPAELAPLLGALAWSFRSVPLANEAVELGRKSGDATGMATALAYLAITALIDGDATTAVAYLSECARTWTAVDERPQLAWTIARMGTARLRVGDVDAARMLLKDALGQADQPANVVHVSLSALEGAADWLGAVGRPKAAAICWAAVDARQAETLDRTDAHETGLFLRSRERDLSALSRVDKEAARSRGAEMTLIDAVDYAIRLLDEPVLNGSDRRSGASGRQGRYDLTPREREVLEMLAAGRSDGQIAEALFISKKTAAVHVGNIKGKLGASSRVEIATIALRTGLVAEP